MKARILVLILGAALAACSSSASYQEGQAMADRTYGSMSPEQLTARIDSILRQVQSDLEESDEPRQWWDGFCDRGEEIWIERIDLINSAMGQQVYKPATVKAVFRQMRSSFRE